MIQRASLWFYLYKLNFLVRMTENSFYFYCSLWIELNYVSRTNSCMWVTYTPWSRKQCPTFSWEKVRNTRRNWVWDNSWKSSVNIFKILSLFCLPFISKKRLLIRKKEWLMIIFHNLLEEATEVCDIGCLTYYIVFNLEKRIPFLLGISFIDWGKMIV